MDEVASVAFPYFGNREHDHFEGTDHESVLLRSVPARKLKLTDGDTLVATVFDLFVANYGLDRGLEDSNSAKTFDDDLPYTPAWAEQITGVPRENIITVAREFARNAEKTNGRSMVILGAGLNHWYHMDMNYRGIINLLVMCGCVRPVRRRLGATMWVRKNCVRKPAGCRWPSVSTGAVRRGR